MAKSSLQRPKLLLVEGQDEQRFFSALLRHLALDQIEVRPMGGKDNLVATLHVLVNGPQETPLRAVGLVRDADNDPRAAFASVCAGLNGVDLPVPNEPVEIVTKNEMRIGVLILPGGGQPGMLEDLCLASVQSNPAMICVHGFMECLAEQQTDLPQNPAKARVRAFLSSRQWLEERYFRDLQASMQAVSPLESSTSIVETFLATRYKPTLRLGEAAEAAYWPFDHEAFSPICHFLRSL